MFNFLKTLFSGSGQNAVNPDEQFQYNGFQISPIPQKENGGFRVEAYIEKELNGVMQKHHFIRADKTGSREECLELIERKTKLFIDQMGDQIF